MMICGIDPGLKGGLGFLNDKCEFVSCAPMPVKAKSPIKNEVDAAALAQLLKPASVIILERQAPMPKQGISSAFSLGDSHGVVRGVCATLGLPLHQVSPHTWKQHFNLPGKNKELARSKAINLFPTAPLSRKKDEGIAEALLIALWAIRTKRV